MSLVLHKAAFVARAPRASPSPKQHTAELRNVLAKTLAHLFPEWRSWLKDVRETRKQELIVHESRFLLWMGRLLFLLKVGSRRQTGFERDSPEALGNLNRLSGSHQETRAHHDTRDHFLGHVHPAEWKQLRRKMVFRLIRMKAWDPTSAGRIRVRLDGL